VADPKESRRAGNLSDVGGNLSSEVTGTDGTKLAFKPKQVRGYERADELIADPEIDAVSICTRTDTHVDLATRALAAGKHVLIEKPVALSVDEIDKIRAARDASGKICMPAMCMRYWPGWQWLKQKIEDKSLGKCMSATFMRLAAPPAWSRKFFLDGAKSGGALMDFHIHDADFVLWCFGTPRQVCSAGRRGPSGAVDHVTSFYQYERKPDCPELVTAEGGFAHHPGFAFRMRYVAVFENATADFDLGRTPQLVLCRDGKAEEMNIPVPTGYEGEVRALIAAICSNSRATLPTLEDAAAVTKLLDAERQSVLSRTPVELRNI
jgi:predicted dehydrogenase